MHQKSEGITMQVKGHVVFRGAIIRSCVLLTSADPIGSERKTKETSDVFPLPSLPSLTPQGAALRFPRVAKCNGQH